MPTVSINELTTKGAVAIRDMLDLPQRVALLEIIQSLHFKRAEEFIAGDLVRQQVFCFELGPEHSHMPWLTDLEEIASDAKSAVISLFPDQSLFSGKPEPKFNRTRIYRCTQDSIGITSHKDQREYINLVVAIVVAGKAQFSMRRKREGEVIKRIFLNPGDGILLAVRGFNGLKWQDIPYHQFTPSGQETIIFGLRQSTQRQI